MQSRLKMLYADNEQDVYIPMLSRTWSVGFPKISLVGSCNQRFGVRTACRHNLGEKKKRALGNPTEPVPKVK